MKGAQITLLGFLLAVGGLAAEERATWDEQNTAMGWFILHISGVNAINGLNLSRGQAVQLRGLAREMEAVAPKPPSLNKAYRADLVEVRDTYSELRGVLIEGKEVPQELEAKVMRARGIESAVIRLSLANPTRGKMGCQRCHGEPSLPDVRSQASSTLANLKMSDKSNQKETFIAHMMGAYGVRGSVKLTQLAPQVDKVLNESQKEIVRTFACCLIPPKGLNDPVRAGQASGGEKEIEILRGIRKVPPAQWPTVRRIAMQKLDVLMAAKTPGATETEKSAARKRVGAVFDKVRSMDETEFEMEKGSLAADLHGEAASSANLKPSGQRFMAAYFLLLPGSVEVYDKLIKRLDAKKG